MARLGDKTCKDFHELRSPTESANPFAQVDFLPDETMEPPTLGRGMGNAIGSIQSGQKKRKGAPRTEDRDPAKLAEFIHVRQMDPTKSMSKVAKQVGLPRKTAEELEKRLKHEYAAEVEEIELVTQDIIERRLSKRLNAIDQHLTPQRMEEILSQSKGKDLALIEAIYTDKWFQGRSTPVNSVSQQEQKGFDEVVKAFNEVMKARGLTVTASERKLEFETK